MSSKNPKWLFKNSSSPPQISYSCRTGPSSGNFFGIVFGIFGFFRRFLMVWSVFCWVFGARMPPYMKSYMGSAPPICGFLGRECPHIWSHIWVALPNILLFDTGFLGNPYQIYNNIYIEELRLKIIHWEIVF